MRLRHASRSPSCIRRRDKGSLIRSGLARKYRTRSYERGILGPRPMVSFKSGWVGWLVRRRSWTLSPLRSSASSWRRPSTPSRVVRLARDHRLDTAGGMSVVTSVPARPRRRTVNCRSSPWGDEAPGWGARPRSRGRCWCRRQPLTRAPQSTKRLSTTTPTVKRPDQHC